MAKGVLVLVATAVLCGVVIVHAMEATTDMAARLEMMSVDQHIDAVASELELPEDQRSAFTVMAEVMAEGEAGNSSDVHTALSSVEANLRAELKQSERHFKQRRRAYRRKLKRYNKTLKALQKAQHTDKRGIKAAKVRLSSFERRLTGLRTELASSAKAYVSADNDLEALKERKRSQIREYNNRILDAQAAVKVYKAIARSIDAQPSSAPLPRVFAELKQHFSQPETADAVLLSVDEELNAEMTETAEEAAKAITEDQSDEEEADYEADGRD